MVTFARVIYGNEVCWENYRDVDNPAAATDIEIDVKVFPLGHESEDVDECLYVLNFHTLQLSLPVGCRTFLIVTIVGMSFTREYVYILMCSYCITIYAFSSYIFFKILYRQL